MDSLDLGRCIESGSQLPRSRSEIEPLPAGGTQGTGSRPLCHLYIRGAPTLVSRNVPACQRMPGSVH